MQHKEEQNDKGEWRLPVLTGYVFFRPYAALMMMCFSVFEACRKVKSPLQYNTTGTTVLYYYRPTNNYRLDKV